MERVGYTETWSVKDLLAHLGSWFAEACVVLEQIRMGTHERRKVDVEANNDRYYEIWKDVDLARRARASSGPRATACSRSGAVWRSRTGWRRGGSASPAPSTTRSTSRGCASGCGR